MQFIDLVTVRSVLPKLGGELVRGSKISSHPIVFYSTQRHACFAIDCRASYKGTCLLTYLLTYLEQRYTDQCDSSTPPLQQIHNDQYHWATTDIGPPTVLYNNYNIQTFLMTKPLQLLYTPLSESYTVKPVFFACPLFREFCEPGKFAKITGRENLNTVAFQCSRKQKRQNYRVQNN